MLIRNEKKQRKGCCKNCKIHKYCNYCGNPKHISRPSHWLSRMVVGGLKKAWSILFNLNAAALLQLVEQDCALQLKEDQVLTFHVFFFFQLIICIDLTYIFARKLYRFELLKWKLVMHFCLWTRIKGETVAHCSFLKIKTRKKWRIPDWLTMPIHGKMTNVHIWKYHAP